MNTSVVNVQRCDMTSQKPTTTWILEDWRLESTAWSPDLHHLLFGRLLMVWNHWYVQYMLMLSMRELQLQANQKASLKVDVKLGKPEDSFCTMLIVWSSTKNKKRRVHYSGFILNCRLHILWQHWISALSPQQSRQWRTLQNSRLRSMTTFFPHPMPAFLVILLNTCAWQHIV